MAENCEALSRGHYPLYYHTSMPPMLSAVAQGLKSSHFKCPSSDGSRQVPGEDHHTVLTGMAGAAGKHGFWGVQVIRLAYLGSKLLFFFFSNPRNHLTGTCQNSCFSADEGLFSYAPIILPIFPSLLLQRGGAEQVEGREAMTTCMSSKGDDPTETP